MYIDTSHFMQESYLMQLRLKDSLGFMSVIVVYTPTEVCKTEERLRSWSGFALVQTLKSIEESRAARLAVNRTQYRALSRRTRTLLRRDKERYCICWSMR